MKGLWRIHRVWGWECKKIAKTPSKASLAIEVDICQKYWSVVPQKAILAIGGIILQKITKNPNNYFRHWGRPVSKRR